MGLVLPLEQITQQHVRNSLGVVNDNELAEALGVSPTTLAIWRSKKLGPTYVKLGKNVFYTYDDLCSWVESQRVLHAGREQEETNATQEDPFSD